MRETKRSYTMVGRQRRFSPELKHAIMQKLRQGARPSDIQGEFNLCYNSVAKFRRLLGTQGDRKHWRKLSPAVLQEAEQRLRAGDTWRHIATDLHVSPQTIATHLRFRKRAKRK